LQKDFRFTDSERSRLFTNGLFEERRRGNVKRLLFFFAYSSLLLLFCTKNAPLYAFNDWPDPNIYMSVGRAVSKGAVLYRDVFEQKGPLFLLLFSLLSVVTPFSMLSLFALQCVSLTASLEILCRTAKMFVPASAAFKMSLFFPVFLLNYLTYYQGGGSAEELMLPLFLGGMYFLLRYFSGRTDATKSGSMLSPVAFMVLGIFSGIAVFSKISLSLFFLVCVVSIFSHMLYLKKFPALWKALLLYVTGILLSSLPCLIYCFTTRSFTDAWDTYIVFNMRYAADRTSDSLLDTIVTLSVLNIWSVVVMVFGAIAIFADGFRLNTFGKIAVSASIVVLTTMVILPCRPYNYVFIPLLVWVGIGEIGLYLMIKRYRENRNRDGNDNAFYVKVPVAAVILLAFATVVFSNALFPESRLFRKEKTGIEEISETIRQSWDQNGNTGAPSLLIYAAYDNGLYGLSETWPQVKYFQIPVVSGTTEAEILLEQERYISEGLPDYVVTIGYKGESVLGIVDTINGDYEIIDSEAEDSQRCDLRITLYMRK